MFHACVQKIDVMDTIGISPPTKQSLNSSPNRRSTYIEEPLNCFQCG